MKIIDTADNVTRALPRLVVDGIKAIIRYDDRHPSSAWKQIQPAEAQAIQAAGVRLGIVNQHINRSRSDFGASNGYLDASYSRRIAPKRGQPAGSAVYFAVDYDAPASDIPAVLAFFDGVARAFSEDNNLPQLRFGAYCSGAVARALKAKHPDALIWITCSLGFTGSREVVASGSFDLFQGTLNPTRGQCDKDLHGLSVDYCTENTPDWGSFVPWGSSAPAPVPKPPLSISHDTEWLQTVLAKSAGYSGEVDGDVGPLTIAAMIKYIEQHELQAGGAT